jgi:DNA-binding transcriptional LysR family regulator
MFIRQLYYLTALSKEKHFARAAEVCHVSQPTPSAGIQHLEEELGVAIVKRAQRFEGFTPEGERVLAWAQHIQANWDGLKQDVRGMCGDPAGELRCGAIPTALPIVSLLTGPCRTRYPGITHCILSLSAVEIIRRIEAFDLDVGITYLEHPKHEQLLELPFTTSVTYSSLTISRALRHARLLPGPKPDRSPCVCSRRTCKIAVSLTPRLTTRA